MPSTREPAMGDQTTAERIYARWGYPLPTLAGGDPEGDSKPEGEGTPPAETPPAETPPADPPKDDEPLGEPGKKALDAERAAKKAAEKALAEALATVKEYEDRDKSETEKLAERAQTAEQAAGEAQAKLNRLMAALKAGLSPEMADRLRGDTPEALEADATALKAQIGDGATPPPGSFDGGTRPHTPEKSLDEQIQAAIEKSEWSKVDVLNARKLQQLVAKQK